MGLTSKQELFCKNIVSGLSYKDSYLQAYKNKSNDNTAYKEATKLLMRKDIKERIQELNKPLELQAQTIAISEREKKRTWLWDMINNPSVGESDKLRAMDILNKMDSEYININKNIDENNTEINNLDTTTLLKLVK